MKNLIVIAFFGLISLTSNAQKTIEKNIEYKNQLIDINLKFANNIEIQTWDKSNIFFKAVITTKDGKYLDAYKLEIAEKTSTISISSESEGVFKKFREEWDKNPKSEKQHYYNSGDWYKFNYTVYIPKNAKFKVSSINGDLKSKLIQGTFTADLINGDIDITSYTGNLNLSTINGEIDLKMDNANIVAETIHGDIYADEKLNFEYSKRHVGQKISCQIAQGKNDLKLKTINGNMYLRL